MKVDRSVSTPATRILAAADKLFYANGIRAVGVDAVAAAAGVSKRTMYQYYRTKDDLIAAYLTARLRAAEPSDAPARDQILGYFDGLARTLDRGDFRGCPYVNAVAEITDPKHPAAAIARQFKAQRLEWYRKLLGRMGARRPEAVATQLQLLIEGAISSYLVLKDPSVARTARAAAEVLLDAALPAKRRA